MMLNEILAAKLVCDGGAVLGVLSTSMLALSDSVANAMILGVVTVATTTVGAYFAYKAKAIAQETHKAVNGQMEAFKELQEKAYRAEGKSEAKAEAEVIAAAEAKGRAEVVLMTPPTAPLKEQAIPLPLPITIAENK